MTRPRASGPGPALALALALLAAASGCSHKASREPAAGLYALRGGGKVTREEPKLLRSPRPGMTLAFDMVLELDQKAVLEGLNGAFVALDSGRHRLASINALRLESKPTRRVVWVTDVSEPREVGALITAVRYEPLESGKPLKDPSQDSFADNAAFLFLPQGGKERESERPSGAPPPWMGAPSFVRPLHRPLSEGDGRRALTSAEGDVVVEFEDRATALVEDLKLPVDLAGVRRIVVARGRARLSLPNGKSAAIDDGQVAEIVPLP